MKRSITAALAVAGALAVPAASQAATDFGSRLNNNPANSGECQDLMGQCTLASYIHPSAPNGDPYAGGAPTDGVITKFKIRALGKDGAGPAGVTFRLVRFQNVTDQSGSDSAVAQAAGTGPTVQITGTPDANNDARIEQFPARVSVKKGDHLAIDTKDAQATYNNSGDEYSFLYSPALTGQGLRASTEATGELLVAATIEADADRDGFGDETQDACKGQGGAAGGCDRTSPVLSALKAKKGRVSYSLSEAARVTFKVQKAKKGRYRQMRTLKATGKAGKNSLRMPKKLRKAIKKGRYRVVATATDPAGNKAAKRIKKFRVKR